MNLIILTEADRIDADRFRISDHRAEHIRSILKSRVGETVEIGLLNGAIGKASIEDMGEDSIVLLIRETVGLVYPLPQIDLICALPRPQTLKKILLTSAMMGVRRLDLIRARRVERSYYHSPLLEPENYRPYLLEGLAQGKLTRLPEVQVHERFRPFMEDVLVARDDVPDETTLKLLPHPEATLSVGGIVNMAPPPSAIQVAIGPEGGWVDFELELMQQQGFSPVLLSRWVLRVEHAVTAALAQIELLRLS